MSYNVEEMRNYVLGAISKIKGQRQQPNEERITKVLFQLYGVEKGIALRHLQRCVDGGILVTKTAKSGKLSYVNAQKVVHRIGGMLISLKMSGM